MLPGPAEPGCSLVSFHFLWAILCPHAGGQFDRSTEISEWFSDSFSGAFLAWCNSIEMPKIPPKIPFRDGHLGNMLKGHVQTARNYKQKTLPKILPSFGRAIELASTALEQLGHMMKCRNLEGFSEAVNRIALWESCRDSSTREIHLRILPKIHLNMKLGRAIELASWSSDIWSYRM